VLNFDDWATQHTDTLHQMYHDNDTQIPFPEFCQAVYTLAERGHYMAIAAQKRLLAGEHQRCREFLEVAGA